jgi:hypothetical protein
MYDISIKSRLKLSATILSLYHLICSLEVIIRYDSHRPEGIPHFMRAVMRLLHLHSSGQLLTESQWSDLLSLKTNIEPPEDHFGLTSKHNVE